MTLNASSLLVFPLGLAMVVVVAGRRAVTRQVRRPRRVMVAVVVAAGVLLPANLYFAVGRVDAAAWSVEPVVVLGTVAALAGLALMWLAERIPRDRTALPRRVLAIGAHPDDVELGCGGTLAKLVDSGHEVRALVLSAGETGGRGPVRCGEVAAAGRLLGLAGFEVLDLPDTRLAECEQELVAAIERVLDQFNPDIILTHSANDVHQDHQAVHAATLRAGRRRPSILCYESPSATAEFRPSVFVDVQDHLHVKVSAVAAHRDQRAKPYMAEERLRGLASFRGGQAKVRHAEGYEPVRLLGNAGMPW